MRVYYLGMIHTDGQRSTFRGSIVKCRWTDRAAGKWSGRHVADINFEYTFHGRIDWHQVRDLEREQAARLGVPALHDTFQMACPDCNGTFCSGAR